MSDSDEEFQSADEGADFGMKQEVSMMPDQTTSTPSASTGKILKNNQVEKSGRLSDKDSNKETSSKAKKCSVDATPKSAGISESKESAVTGKGKGNRKQREQTKRRQNQSSPDKSESAESCNTRLDQQLTNVIEPIVNEKQIDLPDPPPKEIPIHSSENDEEARDDLSVDPDSSPTESYELNSRSGDTNHTSIELTDITDLRTDQKSDLTELAGDERNAASENEVKVNSPSESSDIMKRCESESTNQYAASDSSQIDSQVKEPRNVLDRLSAIGAKKQSQSSAAWGSWGGGWSSWGSNILSTATSSINTFTDQVSEGMHTVVETFEQSVGASPAEQLASELSEYVKEPEGEPLQLSDSESSGKESPAAEGPRKSLESTKQDDWLAGVRGNLQSTSLGLMTSGLGVLETIGKKTMDHIHYQDPGFHRTKNLLRGQKVNLSQILREAAAETDLSTHDETKMANLSILFDHCQGLVHLEAMEMLSITSLNVLTSGEDDRSPEVTDTLEQVANKFSEVQLSDDDDDEPNADYNFATGIAKFKSKIEVDVNTSRLLETSNSTRMWQEECEKEQDKGVQKDGLNIHRQALSSFAQLTALVIEVFRKSAELLLLKADDTAVDVDMVTDCYIRFLELAAREIHVETSKYNTCLNTAADDSEDPDSVNELITNVFLESANCKSYMSAAFKLLKPVLQHLYVKQNCS